MKIDPRQLATLAEEVRQELQHVEGEAPATILRVDTAQRFATKLAKKLGFSVAVDR